MSSTAAVLQDSKKGQCNEHPEKKGSTEDDQFLALVRANRQQTGLTLRLDTVAPFSLTEAPFMYQRAAAPLFKCVVVFGPGFCLRRVLGLLCLWCTPLPS